MKDHDRRFSLHAGLNLGYVRLVTTFVEESARAFGLQSEDAMKLTLAAEEIFAYLCRAGRADGGLAVEAADGNYYVQITFLFQDPEFDPRGFNLTAHVSLEDAEGLEEMGLLIASRTVDRFHIAGNPRQGLELVLTQEKSYPAIDDLKVPEIRPMERFSIKTPDTEGLKLFSRLTAACYPDDRCLPAFRFPGKIADMISSGEYGAAVAVSPEGQIGGGIFWHWVGDKTVESFGPYLFNQPASLGLAQALFDSCLERIAKTEAIGLIHRCSATALPEGYFESLGSVDVVRPDGATESRPVCYRQLNEDLGCRVWVHPDLEGFLRSEYRRLFLARDMQITRYEGERRPAHSVFAPRFDRANGRITLQPVWDGRDVADNLAQHVRILKAEGLPNIFFELDLAFAWHANLTPALLASDFRPRLVLPYGGEADVVVFQYHREGT